jgi:LemA protein
MQTILSFLSFIFWTVVLIAAVVAFLAFKGYNTLRLLSENVKEAWSNIGVTVGKQASLINQLINTVSSYAEGEKLVMLKVSQDASLGAVQQAHQQGGLVLSAVNGMAQKFPDLKANGQYVILMKSITDVENQLEHQRQSYNAATKEYNVRRTSIPDVFYSKLLGFGEAPYLDFDGSSEKNAATMQQFVTDDGERLNQLLSSAGNKVKEVSQQAASAALSQGKQIAAVAKSKVEEMRQPQLVDATVRMVAPDSDDATIVAVKPVGLKLMDVGGTADGKSFDVPARGWMIGRADTADLVVQDGQVSKHHLWVGQQDGRWDLKDQNSSNGTFTGTDLENRVTELPLTPDMIVSLGSHGATKFKVAFA